MLDRDAHLLQGALQLLLAHDALAESKPQWGCLPAQVHAALGNNCAAFLDLQRLKNVAPEHPGLFELLRHAAAHAQREQGDALPSQVIRLCFVDGLLSNL